MARQVETRGRSPDERYRTLFEQAPIGVFLFDAGSERSGPKVTEFNPAFASILRVAPEQIRDFDLFTIRDARLRPAFERVLRGQPAIYEGPYEATLSGVLLNVWVRLTPLRGDDGAVIGGMGLVEDVTERVQAAEIVAESAQRLSHYVERNPLAVIGFNVDFEIVEWNAAACRTFGYSAEEALGKFAPDLILEKPLPADVETVWQQLLTRTGGWRNTNENVTKDGRTILCDWFNATLVGLDGHVTGVLSICADVTERRQAEEALKRSEARFRAVIEAAPDAIGVHRDGRWLYVNPALVRYLGYDDADDLVGGSLERVVDPTSLATLEVAPSSLLGDKRTPREIKLRRRDGAPVLAEIVSIQVDYDGAPAIVAQARDVTERTQMQARLLQADRMVSVGTLAAGVAHEINNPLAYMMANLDVLASRRIPALLAEVQSIDDAPETRATLSERLVQVTEMIQIVREGADRVREIVRDLKTFSRADDDRRGPLDVRRVLDASINMAWNEIRHRAMLVKEYAEVPSIDANESRLGQVFLNLLINAAQALPVGEASAHTIRVGTATDRQGRIVVSVSDTGPGIPTEIRSRIFDPFFTTKPIGVGTGLGLSICQGIVGSLGGEILVESDPGLGTTFRVVLPTERRSIAAPDPIVTPSENRVRAVKKRGRVLIIDDEIALGDVLRDALSEQFDVAVARSGRQGLDHLARARFDVVLCDLMMPDVSGMDVYEQVFEKSPDQAAQIVFVTGGAFTARAREFLAAVPNARVDKPFDLDELIALVRARLG